MLGVSFTAQKYSPHTSVSCEKVTGRLITQIPEVNIILLWISSQNSNVIFILFWKIAFFPFALQPLPNPSHPLGQNTQYALENYESAVEIINESFDSSFAADSGGSSGYSAWKSTQSGNMSALFLSGTPACLYIQSTRSRREERGMRISWRQRKRSPDTDKNAVKGHRMNENLREGSLTFCFHGWKWKRWCSEPGKTLVWKLGKCKRTRLGQYLDFNTVNIPPHFTSLYGITL